jgi:hypothetical protein
MLQSLASEDTYRFGFAKKFNNQALKTWNFHEN